MPDSRRAFLKSSLAASSIVSLGGTTIPSFLAHSAAAASVPGPAASGSDRILVVIQLIGGNDGLNTVVPHRSDAYVRTRRTLRLPRARLISLGDEIGLHPAMGGFAKLMDRGHAAIVQGVGYPNPDRSHFRSMEIWESGRIAPEAPETGWLGRALDLTATGTGEVPVLHVGRGGLPLACRARRATTPSFETLDQFRLQVEGQASERRASRDAIGSISRHGRDSDDPLLGFIRRSSLAAYASSERLDDLVQPHSSTVKYPDRGLARRLELIARIIKSGFGTRIFYTSLDGFDTHANQAGTHEALLIEFSDSLAAFHADLAASGESDRVATLAFSEFGRRVAENASAGTDHGAAAPVFVAGPLAKTGLVGDHPDLDGLDDGDLEFHTDFRRIYADLLDSWLGIVPTAIVGEGYQSLGLFSPGRA